MICSTHILPFAATAITLAVSAPAAGAMTPDPRGWGSLEPQPIRLAKLKPNPRISLDVRRNLGPLGFRTP